MIKRVFFCNCHANKTGSTRSDGILNLLNQSGFPFIKISDFCGCSVDRETETPDLFTTADESLIIACYPRSVKLLLEKCGIDLQSFKYNVLNFRELNHEDILAEVGSFCAGNTEKGEISEFDSYAEWPSWFPIIDYSRCNSCGQCADFCLFGVYEKINNKIVVVNPKSCKNNCPACGRICPQTAIVFPKYEHNGAIAGSEIIDEIAEHQRQSKDIETILGSNIYKSMEMRKAKRQSIIRSAAMQKAIEERDRALEDKTGK
jgi:NAD-dependent dihydropyrimidine dehydrogenase PreA subunit